MNTQIAPLGLGQNILIVMDSVPGFLDALRSATESLRHISHRSFTLLCCHPAHYWEHGGADNPEGQEQISSVWQARNAEFDRAKHCLEQARTILQAAGVPDAQIQTKTAFDDNSIITATMNELNQGLYTGVIVSRYRKDIVGRLQRKGLMDMFRKIPKVEVWPLDLTT